MKISLNLRQNEDYTSDTDKEKALDRDVLACRKGDWEAKTRVIQAFMPLLTSLARKRSSDTATVNRFIDGGKEGLMTAVRHFKDSSHAKFQIFAMRYVEDAMDNVNRPSLLARFFSLFR